MKVFFWEILLPFGGVVTAIVAFTLALFDVPSKATEPVFGLRIPATAQPVARSRAARTHVDDTLSQVLRTLDVGRRPRVPEAAATASAARELTAPLSERSAPATTAAVTPVVPKSDTELVKTATSLGDAVRAIHDARTEEDLVRAEELVRVVRERMEANCATGAGPMCQSAEQIRSLGY